MNLYDPNGSLRQHRDEWTRRLFWRSVRHGLIYTVALLTLAAIATALWS